MHFLYLFYRCVLRLLEINVYICYFDVLLCFFKQKTAYDMRISDWSSDVCSSDLNLVFGTIVATMMVPFIVIMVPQYILVREFGWLDSYAGLIIPAAISSLGIFLMRQAFAGMPDEMIDAPRMDGAREWRIPIPIVVPTHAPALASRAILQLPGARDRLLWPRDVTTGDS